MVFGVYTKWKETKEKEREGHILTHYTQKDAKDYMLTHTHTQPCRPGARSSGRGHLAACVGWWRGPDSTRHTLPAARTGSAPGSAPD